MMHILNITTAIILSFLIFLPVTSLSPTCPYSQKYIHLSYNTMSKRDTLPNLFTQLSTKLPYYNKSQQQQQTTYNILKLHPQLTYNQHNQLQSYINASSINVTLGKLKLKYQFNYQIISNNTKNIGIALGFIVIDNTYFTKYLINKDGYLQWQPSQIHNLTSTQQLTIQYSQPKLTFNAKQQYQYMLNNHTLVNTIFNDVNNNYISILHSHLNSQHLADNTTIVYQYNKIKTNFVNVVKNYSISQKQNQGLDIQIYWECQNVQSSCISRRIMPTVDFGGLQQIYALNVFKDVFKYYLQQGLIDTIVDNKWQVPVFQFFMGDLQISIPQSINYRPDQPFTLSCKWNKTTPIKLSQFTNSQIYTQLSTQCILKAKQKQLLNIQLVIYFIVKILAQNDNLIFTISRNGLYNASYKSIDPKFVVVNTSLLKFQIQSVLKGLEKRTVLGTGWKTIYRRFPSAYIGEDYVIIFDASQI